MCSAATAPNRLRTWTRPEHRSTRSRMPWRRRVGWTSLSLAMVARPCARGKSLPVEESPNTTGGPRSLRSDCAPSPGSRPCASQTRSAKLPLQPRSGARLGCLQGPGKRGFPRARQRRHGTVLPLAAIRRSTLERQVPVARRKLRNATGGSTCQTQSELWVGARPSDQATLCNHSGLGEDWDNRCVRWRVRLQHVWANVLARRHNA